MLEGITAGFILSLALFPGTVWLVKVGLTGGSLKAFIVTLGFALSQFFWLMVAIPGLLMMTKHLAPLRPVMHIFAAVALVYMAFKTFRSRRLETLEYASELPSLIVLFRDAFNRALAMPMRLPIAMAILLATGVYANNPPTWDVVPSVLLGGFVGVAWWWGQLFVLTVLFAKRVPEPITLKSLNKIRPFCGVLLGLLAVVSLLFA